MFEKWKSIPRLNKEVIVTEKLDGTNAQIHITPEATIEEIYGYDRADSGCVLAEKDGLLLLAGSRSRYISVEDDNFGFAKWVQDNHEELFKLGPGRHYGEWWGLGIQRGYALSERRLSMFNPRWEDQGPQCVSTAPILARGTDLSVLANYGMAVLREKGSFAAPGFMDPEGIIVYHSAANQMFKTTFDFDEGKWSEESE